MRQNLFYSILLAAVASAPLAFAVVVFRWNHLEVGAGPDALHDATIALMRTFVISFDVFVLTTWLPCAVWFSRFKSRLIMTTERPEGGILRAIEWHRPA